MPVLPNPELPPVGGRPKFSSPVFRFTLLKIPVLMFPELNAPVLRSPELK